MGAVVPAVLGIIVHDESTMLQAHSLLWHYLWVGPHILQLLLAVFMWRRGMGRLFPVFLSYLIFEAVEELTLYGLDVSPSVSGETFWRFFCFGLIVEGLIKLGVIGELFFCLLRPWSAVAKVGSRLISGIGAILVLSASLAAAFMVPDNNHWLISGSHILQQTFYIVECGLLMFLFCFAAYFRLPFGRQVFGIALGIGILSSEHLASWAMTASGALLDKRYLLDFLNLATYHVCVLVWFYYLLVPHKNSVRDVAPLPEHSLELWNRELERLLQ